MASSKRWTGLQFGKNLKLERERRGWTQEQLAQKLRDAGLQSHWATVSKIENGERSVRVDEAAAIADLFDNMSIDALVGRTANPGADDTYTIQKAAQLVQRSHWQNRELADELRGHADNLTGRHPELAKQIIAVAKALEKASEAANNFGTAGGEVAAGTKAALKALIADEEAGR